eukprot:scaffold156438_cov24-Tisochrysis_lutea.AAC.2
MCTTLGPAQSVPGVPRVRNRQPRGKSERTTKVALRTHDVRQRGTRCTSCRLKITYAPIVEQKEASTV